MLNPNFLSLKTLAVAISTICVCCAMPGELSSCASAQERTAAPNSPSFAGPMKITNMLWDTNPQLAAKTLRKAIQSGLDRGQLEPLRDALPSLKGISEPSSAEALAAEAADPRGGPALAARVLLDQISTAQVGQGLSAAGAAEDKLLIFRCWLAVDAEPPVQWLAAELIAPSKDQVNEKESANSEFPAVEPGTADSSPNAWLRKAVDYALQASPIVTATVLLEDWNRLPSDVQAAAIEPLSASSPTMTLLLQRIKAGELRREWVNTNQLQKWLESDNTVIREAIQDIWGTIRAGDDASRQLVINQTLDLLNSGRSGSVQGGEKVFARVCSQCHQLHGQGEQVGPDITSNGRGNLQQLLSNVFDPSLVIGEAFHAKIVLTTDGDIVSGLLVEETDEYLSLKLQGGKTIQLHKADDIEQIKDSPQSLMPAGLEQQMSEREMLDLFAYLCLVKPPESVDNELISGTPDHLVAP